MPRKALKSSLEDLRNEVDAALQAQDAVALKEVRARLDVIMEDIDGTADESIKAEVHGIQDAVSELEVTHPRITSALNQVMHLLSSLGI
ncbi:MAG: DUF4404 family protein [Puniceicoccaceae bacterium]